MLLATGLLLVSEHSRGLSDDGRGRREPVKLPVILKQLKKYPFTRYLVDNKMVFLVILHHTLFISQYNGPLSWVGLTFDGTTSVEQQ